MRLLRDGDTEGVLDLLLTAFGRWPGIPIAVSPLEHLRWKLRLDESDERRHRIAEIDGKLAGFIMRRRKEVSAYRATDGVPEEDLAFIREPTSRVHLTLGDIDRV
jgi:hypothetical protein